MFAKVTSLKQPNPHDIVYIAIALFLLLLPGIWVFFSGYALNLLTQICIAVLICASLRLLVGSGGILSFGQMLYVGTGAYAAAYAVGFSIPLPLIPPLSGVFALLLAIPTGWLCVSRSNRIYMAMVSLALCELVYALAQVLPQLFGDEMGLQFDRTTCNFWGIDFADPRWIASMSLIYLGALLWFLHRYIRTPAGRWLEGARDDEVLVKSLGMNPRLIRFMAFLVSAFVSGVAGGLLAIELESVNSSLFSVTVSGEYLIFTYLGGISSLLGAVLGGVLMQASNLWLPMLTPAWQLYLGLLFIYMVINWPDGIDGCLRTVFKRSPKAGFDAHQKNWQKAWHFLIGAFGIVCCTEVAYRLWGGNASHNMKATLPLLIGVGLFGLFLLFLVYGLQFINKRTSKCRAGASHGT